MAIPASVAALIAELKQYKQSTGAQPPFSSIDKWVAALSDLGSLAAGVNVQDEGTPVLTPAGTLNFTGAGVTASDSGGGISQINIPGASATIPVQDEGAPIVTAGTLNFAGAGVTVTNNPAGTALITIPGGGAPQGNQPIAMSFGLQPANAGVSTPVLTANGGAVLIPKMVSSSMLLQDISFRNGDTATARSMEWRLYIDVAAGNLAEIPGANGSLAWTPAGVSTRFVPCAAPPVAITQGSYWLCIRNTHATNVLTLGSVNVTVNVDQFFGAQTIENTGPLGATLFAASGWTKINPTPNCFLNGRTFGLPFGWAG